MTQNEARVPHRLLHARMHACFVSVGLAAVVMAMGLPRGCGVSGMSVSLSFEQSGCSRPAMCTRVRVCESALWLACVWARHMLDAFAPACAMLATCAHAGRMLVITGLCANNSVHGARSGQTGAYAGKLLLLARCLSC